MSRTYLATQNKHQKRSKRYFEQYLYNSGELWDDIENNILADQDVKLLLEDIYPTTQRFRLIAQRIRKSYQ